MSRDEQLARVLPAWNECRKRWMMRPEARRSDGTLNAAAYLKFKAEFTNMVAARWGLSYIEVKQAISSPASKPPPWRAGGTLRRLGPRPLPKEAKKS